MFEEDDAMVAALHSEMQPKEGLSLFELQESKQKIERLFKFTRTDSNNTTFPFWCVGAIINVSNGMNNQKWKRPIQGERFYKEDQAAEVHWEAVLGHGE